LAWRNADEAGSAVTTITAAYDADGAHVATGRRRAHYLAVYGRG
jgi:hypothetical protein